MVANIEKKRKAPLIGITHRQVVEKKTDIDIVTDVPRLHPPPIRRLPPDDAEATRTNIAINRTVLGPETHIEAQKMTKNRLILSKVPILVSKRPKNP